MKRDRLPTHPPNPKPRVREPDYDPQRNTSSAPVEWLGLVCKWHPHNRFLRPKLRGLKPGIQIQGRGPPRFCPRLVELTGEALAKTGRKTSDARPPLRPGAKMPTNLQSDFGAQHGSGRQLDSAAACGKMRPYFGDACDAPDTYDLQFQFLLPNDPRK